MQITCGTDIIEIERIKQAILTHEQKFLQEVYTPAEIAYCESKKDSKYQHFAARFAAKEAIFKAIAGFYEDKFTISWQNAEIVNDNNGKPIVTLIDVKQKNLHLDISISHCNEYAIAMCIATLGGET